MIRTIWPIVSDKALLYTLLFMAVLTYGWWKQKRHRDPIAFHTLMRLGAGLFAFQLLTICFHPTIRRMADRHYWATVALSLVIAAAGFWLLAYFQTREER